MVVKNAKVVARVMDSFDAAPGAVMLDGAEDSSSFNDFAENDIMACSRTGDVRCKIRWSLFFVYNMFDVFERFEWVP